MYFHKWEGLDFNVSCQIPVFDYKTTSAMGYSNLLDDVVTENV